MLAVLLAAIYLAWAPSSQDLAAATFRADLFSDHGFEIWTNAWYSGTYVLSYSVIYPPLGALLGPRLVGALAAIAAAALFALVARRRFGERALVPSLWFSAAVCVWLLTGRIPFGLAVPLGLAALLAADARRTAAAALLAALAALASPVAGLFVALAGVALALDGKVMRGGALALGALAPIAALNLAFPNEGYEPFVFSAFIAVPLLAAVMLWLVPEQHRALRIGAVLYTLLALALFVIDNPLGGNVTRLGALFAGPVLALVLWPRGRWLVLAVAIPLVYWQLVAPIRDLRKAAGDPSTELAYYQPLLAVLDRLAASDPPFRVEIPPTRNRWEAAYVARDHPIARGWLRQLESEDFELFTEDELNARAYRAWLERHGVEYVAVAGAVPDYLAEDEVALIDSGLDYLDPVWSNEDWRLFRVESPPRLGVTALGADSFELDPHRAGSYPVSIRYSGSWAVTVGDACIAEAPGGSIVVRAAAPGPIRVEARLRGDPC